MTILLSIWGFFRGLTWQQVMAAGAVLAGIFLYRKGRGDQKRAQETANLKGYIDVRERTDEAKIDAARKVGALTDDELNDSLRSSKDLRD